MSLSEILWCVSTLTCVLSTVGLLIVYKMMERSLSVMATVLHALIIHHEEKNTGKVVRLHPNEH